MTEENKQTAETSWTDQPWLSRAFAAVWALVALATILRPYLHSPGRHWMELQEDDFFYYLKIAENVARGAGSTFNGIVPTNGYHPLWMLLLAAVARISTAWQTIFGFLNAAIIVSTAATFLLAERLLRASTAPRLLRTALAAYVAAFTMNASEGGMEVVLTIPLLLATAVLLEREQYWRRGFVQAMFLGLLLSATILSRVDAGLFVVIVLAGLVAIPRLRRNLKADQVAGLAIGLMPVAFYLHTNHAWFHTWMPISGMAKQLKPLSLPTSPAWHSVFGEQHLKALNFALPAFGCVPLIALWSSLTPIRRLLYTTLLVFPYLYLLLVSMMSDWQLWAWHTYAFRPALCVTFVLFATWTPTVKLLRFAPLCALICLFVLAKTWLPARTARYTFVKMHLVAQQVAEFATTHPGVYAMGDRSGIVGYTLSQPLVQTEGLVMDPAFLSRVKQQQPLREALAAYGVRYYIASAYDWDGGCFDAAEPVKAGPHSPRMTGVFCEPPAAVFRSYPTTLIYDLQPAKP